MERERKCIFASTLILIATLAAIATTYAINAFSFSTPQRQIPLAAATCPQEEEPEIYFVGCSGFF